MESMWIVGGKDGILGVGEVGARWKGGRNGVRAEVPNRSESLVVKCGYEKRKN